MSDLASPLFGAGLPAATALRRRLLDALGAEPQWTVGEDDDTDIIWVAGPLPTFLTVEPVSELTPNLAVLSVRTRCAWVEALEPARHWVADLNHHTTLNRWVLLGDPGPDLWWDTDPADDASPGWQPPSVHARRRDRLGSRPPADAQPTVEVGASFVVGDDTTDLPFTAVLWTVQEQIAKATALVTNDRTHGWGQPAGVSIDDRARSGDQWNDVVYHYDRQVTPHADDDAAPLLQALTEAFTAEQQNQFEHEEAAWYGGGSDTGFTCEVPYGPGPFAGGLITTTDVFPGFAHDDTNSTSLVEAFTVAHPHIGNGLLITLRVPGGATEDEPWWAASLLNAQNRLNGGGNSSGTAHGLGAWSAQLGQPRHVLFLPAAWATALTAEELHHFFRQALANTARLSWASRRVLEPHFDLTIEEFAAGRDGRLSGLAAGANARGPQFGEPGVGTDPGARMLAFSWANLVGGDHQWAWVLPDGAGFDFWPNRHLQRHEKTPCACPDTGSRVTIETPLLRHPSPEALRHALTLQHAGIPAALTTVGDGEYLIARSLLHVHDDTYPWLRAWTPPVAVAHALLSENLDADPGGPAAPAHIDHPTSGPRPDRDEMLTLFDPAQEWLVPPGHPLQRDALALAPLFTASVGHALQWQGDTVALGWSLTFGLGDGSTQPCTVRTTYGPHHDDLIGDCLRISTALEVAAADPVSWCLEANAWLHEARDSTTLGGVGLDPQGRAAYTTIVPVPLDRSTDDDAHASFIGTSLGHHTAAVTALLLSLDGVGAPELTPGGLTDGLRGLVAFYREAGLDLPDGLELTTAASGDAVRVELTRPWVTPGGPGEWPRLGAYHQHGSTGAIRTLIGLDPTHVSIEGLRLLHGAVIGATKMRHTGTEVAARLSSTSHVLAPVEIAAVLYALADEGLLTVDDHGAAAVANAPAPEAQIGLQVEATTSHPAWAWATTVTATLPGNGTDTAPAEPTADPSSWLIGDWHHDNDGHAAFRICLPPSVFAVGPPEARQHLLAAAIRSAASAATRAAGTTAPTSPRR